MCKLLEIPRSNYYHYINNPPKIKTYDYEDEVIKEFMDSKQTYGTRRIRMALRAKGIIISRRKIGEIMNLNGLVSVYTVKQYKVHSSVVNRDETSNELGRAFDNNVSNDVIVSDLTYVNVKGNWHYICILIDLYNREIIGYSTGPKKTANLVHQAFMSADISLKNIRLFHTDRGKEFDNKVIDDLLKSFDIKRSLSRPGNPYDNAVAEATFKTFKTEFCNKIFECSEQLEMELFEYINWFNKFRLHSSLGYQSPIDYRNNGVYSNFV